MWDNRSSVSAAITLNMYLFAPEGSADAFDYNYQFFEAGSMLYDTSQKEIRSESSVVISMDSQRVIQGNCVED